jgi:hypothetical protein
MRYEKSETLELGKAEDLVLVRIDDGVEQNHGGGSPLTSSSAVAYLSEFDDEE